MTQTYEEIGLAERLDQAADPATSPWRLAALADDAEPEVRMTVATNPSASSLTVSRLRRDPDIRVRSGASEGEGMIA
jgi:hypothetical protein